MGDNQQPSHDLDHVLGRREYDARLAELERKIDKLSTDVEDLVTAWRAASWVVGAVKWLGVWPPQ